MNCKVNVIQYITMLLYDGYALLMAEAVVMPLTIETLGRHKGIVLININ